MTQSVFPEQLINALKAEYVSPLVLYLCHESCQENGSLFEIGGGWVAKLRWQRTKGSLFPLNKPLTVESIRDKWDEINDFSKSENPTSGNEAFTYVMTNINSSQSNTNNTNNQPSQKPSQKPALPRTIRHGWRLEKSDGIECGYGKHTNAVSGYLQLMVIEFQPRDVGGV